MLEHVRPLRSKILLEARLKHSTSVLLETTMLDLSCSPHLKCGMKKKVVRRRYLYEISIEDGALKLLPSYRRAYAYMDDIFSMSLLQCSSCSQSPCNSIHGGGSTDSLRTDIHIILWISLLLCLLKGFISWWSLTYTYRRTSLRKHSSRPRHVGNLELQCEETEKGNLPRWV